MCACVCVCCVIHVAIVLTLTLNGMTIQDGTNILIDMIGTDDDDALICQSNVSAVSSGTGNWFLHATDSSIENEDRIESMDPRGWARSRDDTQNGHRLVILKRRNVNRIMEGVFTCNVGGSGYNSVSVGIYHPSK